MDVKELVPLLTKSLNEPWSLFSRPRKMTVQPLPQQRKKSQPLELTKQRRKEKESGGVGGGGVPVAMVNKMAYYGYSYPTAPMYWQEGHVYGQSYSIEGQTYPVGGQSYPGSGYNYSSDSYVPYSHGNMNTPPGMFSDENPNGCSVM
ncbi:hypothetical protein Bca52824_009318 [Brassica carinata]|uniref:Uncharacterized protein n=1 Tax=Brassica carinata TaxID=52824 RepID=A0A8X8B8Z7_BRACI|nr:hypothetical protein Bca52824_009318 [Brassica carinata]